MPTAASNFSEPPLCQTRLCLRQKFAASTAGLKPKPFRGGQLVKAAVAPSSAKMRLGTSTSDPEANARSWALCSSNQRPVKPDEWCAFVPGDPIAVTASAVLDTAVRFSRGSASVIWIRGPESEIRGLVLQRYARTLYGWLRRLGSVLICLPMHTASAVSCFPGKHCTPLHRMSADLIYSRRPSRFLPRTRVYRLDAAAPFVTCPCESVNTAYGDRS